MNRSWTRIPLRIGFVAAIAGASLHGGEPRFRRGDSNGDARVDLTDPIAALFQLFGSGLFGPGLFGPEGEIPCEDAADFDDNGAIEVTDAIAGLSYLFLAGPPPSDPGDGACPGPDPTADSLGCSRGEPEPAERPAILFWTEQAPRSGTRARTGIALATSGGAYRVGHGVSFAILVEAEPGIFNPADVSLTDPENPGAGDPARLRVSCDRPLGDPQAGGRTAGANLAPLFLEEIDLWRDPFHRTERAALRIDGSSPLAPSPGEYRFEAQVVDGACSPSALVEFALEVEPSSGPEVYFWLAADRDGQPEETPRRPSAATGGLTLGEGEDAWLVVAAWPNSSSVPPGPDAEIDPQSLQLFADPPFAPGEDPGTDLGPLAERETAGAGEVKWSLRLRPDSGPYPRRGNTSIRAFVSTRGGAATATARAGALIEVRLSYAADVQPIWKRECTGCHEKPQLEKGLELVGPTPDQTRRRLVNIFAAEPAFDSAAALLIRPYRPDASYLIHKLDGTHLGPPVLGSGERMPNDGPPYLPADDLKTIRDWVLQGAVGE